MYKIYIDFDKYLMLDIENLYKNIDFYYKNYYNYSKNSEYKIYEMSDKVWSNFLGF